MYLGFYNNLCWHRFKYRDKGEKRNHRISLINKTEVSFWNLLWKITMASNYRHNVSYQLKLFSIHSVTTPSSICFLHHTGRSIGGECWYGRRSGGGDYDKD